MRRHKVVEIDLESEQTVVIYPDPEWEGIMMDIKEDGLTVKGPLYLSPSDLDVVYGELESMMYYVTENKK